MNTKKLSLILLFGGAAVTVLALAWFLAAFAEILDMAGDFMGKDQATRMLACLYSSSPLCEGAGMLSEGPAYSPVVFWIGIIALLAGLVLRFVTEKGAGTTGRDGVHIASQQEHAEIMGFIPPGQYARYSYVLALSGAVAGLVVFPFAIVVLAGFVLAVLGLTIFRTRLGALDIHHLGVLCLVCAAAGLLLWITRGTFFFLVAALAQIACIYVGFNSYRHGRTITTQSLKREVMWALKPARGASSSPEQP